MPKLSEKPALKQLKDFKKQPLAARILINAQKNGGVNHAYLFTGAATGEKAALGRSFAALINCQNLEKSGDICFECSSCLKLAKNISPYFIEIKKEPTKKNISIDQIRELKQIVRFGTSLSEGARIVLINRGEDLTEEAQNALLKILEEPARGTIFILVNDNPYLLAETIISRCQKINFGETFDLDAFKISLNFPLDLDLKAIFEDFFELTLATSFSPTHAQVAKLFLGGSKIPLSVYLDISHKLSELGREKLAAFLGGWQFLITQKMKYFFEHNQPGPALILKKNLKVLLKTLADLASNANILLALDFMILRIYRYV